MDRSFRWMLSITIVVLIILCACTAKETATSSPVSVEAGGTGTATRSMPTATATSEPIPIPDPQLRFVDLQDGDTVTLVDTPLGPAVQMQVDADDMWQDDAVFLQIDGLWMGLQRNLEGASRIRLNYTWYPWRGNGDYVLEISRWRSMESTELGATRITVHVDSFPANGTTIEQRIRQEYLQNFGLELAYPVLSFYSKNFPEDLFASRWVSTAYIGDYLYEIDLYTDGLVEPSKKNVAIPDPVYLPICKPAGSYDMLVLVVDYGNTEITQEQAVQAILGAADFYNQRYRDLSTELGAAEPILQVQPTIAYLSSPPVIGAEVPMDQVMGLTGYDPVQFDFFAQVDLDADRTFANQYALGFGGMGCEGADRTTIDIYATVWSADELLPDHMVGILFDHELAHSLGWQHWWPLGDAGVEEAGYSNWLHAYAFPYRLFGWVDSDGDGVLEILDTETPYGWTGK